jgi:glycosyltransferase involved in cell wall biosynthesis
LTEVSVVIPTNGRWRFLSRALEGALRQERIALEVIVVDDGSIGGCPDWLVSQLSDPRVRFVRREPRKGVASARNVGIALAHSDWVAFLDDDDVWSPLKLRTQIDLANRTSADFVYSSAAFVDEELNVLQVVEAPDQEQLQAEIQTYCAIPAGQSNVVARTVLLRELGGFDERLLRVEDWELWIRLAASGNGQPCSEVHVGYVHHPRNMHVVETDLLREMEEVVRSHVIDRSERRRALLRGARWRAHAHRRAGRRRSASREYLRAGVKYQHIGMLLRSVMVLMGEKIMPSHPREFPAARAAEVPWLQHYKVAEPNSHA